MTSTRRSISRRSRAGDVGAARPGRIVDEAIVPFHRPREIDSLVADPQFGMLKQRILHTVRVEARQAMAEELR